MRPLLASGLVIGAFVLLGVPHAWGQTTAAGARGTVRDPSGGVLPGVTVTARDVATGIGRTAVTDREGRYALPHLAVGTYNLRAELTGFRASVRAGLSLTVGSAIVVDFTLQLGEVAETLEVTGAAPVVNVTSAAVAGLVDEKTMRDLPLNGRDFLQLALLQAGALSVTNTSATQGSGTRISFAGARPNQTAFLLDGTDIANTSNFHTPGSAAGVVLGVDTIREFQVLISSFSAEFGNAAGGVINAVTKSGSNELHGSGFEFLRNSRLDARNFFDVDKPPFSRHQFGATVGGPLRRNHTFFFGGYEGLREDLGQTLIAFVPTADARAGRLPDGRTIPVAAAVQPFLPLYPLPNGRDFGNGVAEYTTSQSVPTTEDFFVVRLDHQFGASDSLAGRFSYDDAEKQQFVSPIPNFVGVRHTSARYLALEEKKIFSSRLLNAFRFSFNRTSNDSRDRALVPVDPARFFVPGGEHFGAITFGTTGSRAISNPGVSPNNPSASGLDLLQFGNTLTYSRGAHMLKAGVSMNRYAIASNPLTRPGGEYTFTSLENFLRGVSSQLRIFDPSGGSRERGWRQSLFGMFVQDDVAVRSNLTLNLGLRYEFITTPTEVHGKVSTLRDVVRDRAMTVGDPLFKNPSLKNFAPRVGVVWRPAGSTRTSLRAGFGLYHDELVTSYLNQLDGNPPFVSNAQIRTPLFPDALQALQSQPREAALSILQLIAYEAQQPYLMQFNFGVEREIAPQTMLGLSYVGSRGRHLQRILNYNPRTPTTGADGKIFFPTAAPALNPAFASIRLRNQDGNSAYDSAAVRLNRRFSEGLQFQVSYTYSKSVDDATTSQGPTEYITNAVVLNIFDRKYDRGLSNFDVRHNLSVNYTYELPWGRTLGGLAGAFLKGWQVSGIATFRSGTPLSPIVGFDIANVLAVDFNARPDLTPGYSNNPTSGVTTGCPGIPAGEQLGTPARYFDPCAFSLQQRGHLGNVGRNTIIGPGLATVDLSLSKNFPLGTNRTLQVRAEAFNLLNRANFASPSNVVVLDQAGYVASAGRITSTVTTARQMQFGLRLVF